MKMMKSEIWKTEGVSDPRMDRCSMIKMDLRFKLCGKPLVLEFEWTAFDDQVSNDFERVVKRTMFSHQEYFARIHD
jgi:hypothetical protein